MNRSTFRSLARNGKDVPEPPERVLQFGTGGFLRGFAEYFVQRGNQSGRFSGRVVVVGSTGSQRIRDLNAQDGLYSLVTRGREGGKVVDDQEIVSVIGRALAANEQWNDVLAVACNPDIDLVISNTTEVGIILDDEDQIHRGPPRSFPGKLTALLYERARAFDFDREKGVIVLPCELIESNGDTLRRIVLELADRWKLGQEFSAWISDANTFCNTLVDRIVPGTPRNEQAAALQEKCGYRDALLTVAEPYRLWAIEGDAAFADRFPLAGVDPGIVVTPDISPYRERKVRILNGTHTAMVPAALLSGFQTVLDTVEDAVFVEFVRRLALHEIVPTLDSDPHQAAVFAAEVLERFSNPFIRHELIDITFQQTKKMRVRVIPTIESYFRRFGVTPPSLTLGFACFVSYQNPSARPSGTPMPADDARAYWDRTWLDKSSAKADDVDAVVRKVAADETMWGCRLDSIEGFVDQVSAHMVTIERIGAKEVVRRHLSSLPA